MVGSVPTAAERARRFLAGADHHAGDDLRSAFRLAISQQRDSHVAIRQRLGGTAAVFPEPDLPRHRAELPLRDYGPEHQPQYRSALQRAVEQQGPAEFQFPETEPEFELAPAVRLSGYRQQLRAELLHAAGATASGRASTTARLHHQPQPQPELSRSSHTRRTSRRSWESSGLRRTRSTTGRRGFRSPIFPASATARRT